MWRTTPTTRRELPGARAEDSPPPLPARASLEDIQRPEDGAGPLFHRRYRVRIEGAEASPEDLIGELRRDPNRFAPSEFASFQRVGGDGEMEEGDVYVVRMPGPWDGPVRVVEVTPTSLRLATLEGHLEAGQIEFRAEQRSGLVFTIESWARSGDRLSNLLYDRVRMAKEVQLHMWTSVLERGVERSAGRRAGRIEIDTRRIEEGAEGLLADEDKRHALERLRGARLNFDPDEPDASWHHDDQREALPYEEPGAPVAEGGWEIARRLMRGYEFADPSIVRAYYDPDAPLEGRDMLLELRFLGLRFLAGVRINEVYDRTSEVSGRPVRVWGWSYQTLEGHLEKGQMHWEVWKWLDTGEVEFRVHSVSKRAEIRNPVVRIGFRLFGRREQLRFLRSTRRRMRRLTEEALHRGPTSAAVRRVTENATARPAPGARRVHDQLMRNLSPLSGDRA
jgi:uncharacterized protein (UPF0548 family)